MATTSKPYDRSVPFARIHSPSEGLERALDGNGRARGTRRPSDFPTREEFLEHETLDHFSRELMRTTPSWTTTRGSTEHDAEQEIQGTLVRSFQTWTDVPVFQWHRWYDWNFHLHPDRGFDWLRGAGNSPNQAGELKAEEPQGKGPKGRAQHVVAGAAMECEWDTGAFASESSHRPGPMFDADWAWPMTNQRVWLVGRSIYDGGHETAGLCRSELHPCKAVAAARWEAFNFKENNGGQAGGAIFTPAIQFLFFTSRFGGYVDHPDLSPADGQPYQFIVDLPAPPRASTAKRAIGGPPDTAMNTIVVRKDELLKDFDRKRFDNTRGASSAAKVDPVVELLPVDPTAPGHRQAKVTIPLDALKRPADCYGVLVSLGWRDTTGEQAARVKKCTVKMKSLFKGAIDHDTFTEEWRLKAGVNGRWFQWEIGGVLNNSTHSLLEDEKGRPTERVIYLDEQDALQFSAHGAELNKVDDVYGDSDSDRTLMISNDEINKANTRSDPRVPAGDAKRAADWRTDVDVRPPREEADSKSPPAWRASHPVQRAVARNITWLLKDTFNDQNSPLGLIDPLPTAPRREQDHNPLAIGPLAGKGERSFSLTAYQTWEQGDSAELLERPHFEDRDAQRREWIDYRIDFTVEVEDP